MHRRDISAALLASATGLALLPRQSAAQTCTAPCYTQTAAEAAASVTPVNPSFPPGDVRRYGAQGDGVANDAPAIQAAINAAPANSSVFLPPSALPTASKPDPHYKLDSGLQI